MIVRNVQLAILVAAMWPGAMALAQEGPIAGVISPDARFLEAPGLGERIPDVTIVDDQGNAVNVRELAQRSRYTVLTLGCLT